MAQNSTATKISIDPPETMYRHPHFAKYLEYFINGPKLTEHVVQGFIDIIERDQGTSGMVNSQIQKYCRDYARSACENPAEEFFKLAWEIGQPNFARLAFDA